MSPQGPLGPRSRPARASSDWVKGPRSPGALPRGPQGPPGSDFYKDYTISPIITDAVYNIDETNDYDIYQIDTSLNPITMNLPSISNLDNGKRIYNIVDVGGNLDTNECVISVFSGEKILNIVDNTVTMNVNLSSYKLCSNTVDNWIIL